MEETAYFLNLVVRSQKPVVLVGAMRPATAMSADGPMNLYNAVATAAHPGASGRGVLVVANDEIHFAREVAKTNTTQVGTFKSTNRGLAGLVSSARIHFYGAPVRRHTLGSEFRLRKRGPLPRVDIVYAHAGMGPDLIDASVRAGARGLVLAGVGNGNANRGGGCRGGRGGPGRALRSSGAPAPGEASSSAMSRWTTTASGFIASDELNPQKARILLMLGLTRDARTRERLQEMFYAY